MIAVRKHIYEEVAVTRFLSYNRNVSLYQYIYYIYMMKYVNLDKPCDVYVGNPVITPRQKHNSIVLYSIFTRILCGLCIFR
jgi:hypothetical protein